MDVLSDEVEQYSAGSRPSPQNILAYLPYACCQLEAPFRVKINVEIQGEYQRAEEKVKKTRRSLGPPQAPAPSHRAPSTERASGTQEQETELGTPEIMDDAIEIVLTAIKDHSGHLVELVFNRCVEIPRLLLRVIGFCISYQQHLYRLTVRWGPLTTIDLYEISKFLTESYITEICLDDSPVAGRNYEVLLGRPSRLRYLSLSRCKLDDADCAKLAALLAHPQPASKTLHILILVSNRIGDKGATALGKVLRTNRNLQCLNLAGNYISDCGAISIFKSLMEFPLSNDELFEKRSRHLAYLRLRNEVYARCIKELSVEKSQDEVRLSRRRTLMKAQRKLSIVAGLSSGGTICQKADVMTSELIGSFSDPFNGDQTTIRGGQVYCIGNMVLCSLNLSFNNLGYPSLAVLYEALTHQSWLGPKVATGLLRVGIEGNNLPVDCDELFLIEDLLDRAHVSKQKIVKRPSEKSKGRASKIA